MWVRHFLRARKITTQPSEAPEGHHRHSLVVYVRTALSSNRKACSSSCRPVGAAVDAPRHSSSRRPSPPFSELLLSSAEAMLVVRLWNFDTYSRERARSVARMHLTNACRKNFTSSAFHPCWTPTNNERKRENKRYSTCLFAVRPDIELGEVMTSFGIYTGDLAIEGSVRR